MSRVRRRGGGGDRVYAVNDVSFEVQPGEFFTLLGPSGCGKTTTLRSIAGLERPDAGLIEADGRLLFSDRTGTNVAPNHRGIGMVFQSYAIWPHMTVFDNVAFPLRVRRRREKLSRRVIEQRTMKALEVTELAAFARRSATKLSGGQQQRLALARALVIEPPLLLLDEPLSNLDAKLRENMRFELKRLQSELGLTTIYVTHDQSEALAMSSRVAVLDAGRLVQVGTPQEVYERPANEFVANFIGTMNMIKGTVTAADGGRITFATEFGEMVVADDSPHHRGEEVTLGIRPQSLRIEPLVHDAPRENSWNTTVEGRVYQGDSVEYLLRFSSGRTVRVSDATHTKYVSGDEVRLSVNANDILIIASRPTS